jgi:hypothetical protein
MKSRHFFWLAILFVLLLSGCAPAGSDGQESSEITVVSLQTTPGLAHWLPKAADCAAIVPDLGIYSEIVPHTALDPDQADLTLRLGERLETDPFISVLGSERLVIVAGADVPVESLSAESLRAIYDGKWETWSSVPEVTGLGISETFSVIALSYPKGDELEQLFSQIYLSNIPITSNPLRYSTVDRLRTLLEQNPSAIGFTLECQVPAGVRTLAVTDLEGSPELLVLAITPVEPADGLRQLLLCLQDTQ